MDMPPPVIGALFDDAFNYERSGDVYNAIKLYKKIARLAPDWAPPFYRLGNIYKYRCEWKPALHYSKKAVSLDPSSREAWRNLGISATALKKWGLANNVWGKFGQTPQAGWQPGPLFLRLAYDKQYEILRADAVDPARAVLKNIPHPASGRSYLDVVLVDSSSDGHLIVDRKRFPVYEELGLFKTSGYLTYSCVLESADSQDILLLESLCLDAGLGFEIWSNAARQYSNRYSSPGKEYYPNLFTETPSGSVLVALASCQEAELLHVLRSWEVISLKKYAGLQLHT